MDEHAFSSAQQEGLYRAIYERRDVRSQFLPTPVPDEVLARLLHAAHHAPSVGFMQPWDFVLIRDRTVRGQVKALFDEANQSAARRFAEEGDARASLYPRLKLEGILESPLNLCITCDRRRGGPTVLGRTSILEMDLFSACLAVQNLWLAARAEGVGIGWVSILDNQRLAQLLKLPEHIYPLAYLCVGYVSEFMPEPELQRLGWQQRLPLSELVHLDQWNQHELPASLQQALAQVTIPEFCKAP